MASSTSGGSTRGKRKAVDRYDDIEQQSAPKRSKRISQNAANTTMVLEWLKSSVCKVSSVVVLDGVGYM